MTEHRISWKWIVSFCFSSLAIDFVVLTNLYKLQKIRNQIQGNQPGGEDAHGILEGISSLHSWIKTQTMIRPTKLGVKHSDSGGFSDDEEEDVVISLTSRLYFFEELKKGNTIQPFLIKGPKCVRCPCSLGQQCWGVCSSPFHWDYDRPPWDRLCYTSCRFGWSKGAGADFRVIQNWQFRIFLNASLQICSMSRPGCSTLLTRVSLAAREGREEERIPAQVNRRKRWPWDLFIVLSLSQTRLWILCARSASWLVSKFPFHWSMICWYFAVWQAGPRKIANQFSFIERATQTLVSGNTSTEVQVSLWFYFL